MPVPPSISGFSPAGTVAEQQAQQPAGRNTDPEPDLPEILLGEQTGHAEEHLWRPRWRQPRR